MTMEEFIGKILKGDVVLYSGVGGCLHIRSTGKLYEWSGNMMIPEATPALLNTLLLEPILRLELDDGRVGEFFVTRTESSDCMVIFQGTGSLE